jgi:hypothetical protein
MDIYIPILKLKRGEVFGISKLKEKSKDSVLPLFVAPPPAFDPETDEPLKDVYDILTELQSLISQYWGDRHYLLDFWFYDSRGFFASRSAHLRAFFKTNSYATPCIPVFDPEQADTRALIRLPEIGNKAYLRVLCNEIPDEEQVNRLINETLGNEPDPEGIIFDIGAISADTVSDKRRTAKLFLGEVNERNCLKAIASTSFPETLPSGRYTIHRFQRFEHDVWASFKKRGSIVFSDYTAVNPEYKEFDPRTMSLGGKIRYTLGGEFIVSKGESIKNGGSEQFRLLAQMVRDFPGFRGPEFSWGDQTISECASGEGTLGNQETWVRVAVNQHIQFILDQIQEPKS